MTCSHAGWATTPRTGACAAALKDSLASIGESANKLLGAGIEREAPQAPWRRWTQNRNESSHHYDLVDYAELWHFAQESAAHRGVLQPLFDRAQDHRVEHGIELDYDPRVLSPEQVFDLLAPASARCGQIVAATARACRLRPAHAGRHRSR